MGQADNLRGGCLPPTVGYRRGGTLWVRPIDNRARLTLLPHKVSVYPYQLNRKPNRSNR